MYVWKKRNKKQEDLLAAQSIIRIMFLEREKEKFPSKRLRFPHLEEEIKLIEFVRKLGYKDCEKIFDQVKNLDREEQLSIAKNYFYS